MNDKRKHDLYTLIFDRTLASVMQDAKLERKVRPDLCVYVCVGGEGGVGGGVFVCVCVGEDARACVCLNCTDGPNQRAARPRVESHQLIGPSR